MKQEQSVVRMAGDSTGAPSIILQLRGVTKTYHAQQGEMIRALRDISLDLASGEFVSLVGPSGCGKTTLLKICAGLVSPSTGSVMFGGREGPIPPGTFGMVFQSPALLPWRTVLENVLFPADILHLDKGVAKDRGRRLLELMGLEDVEDKYPGELSGGMQQRVSIARGLLHDPDILLMDEPFGALDAMTREEMGLHLQQVHIDQHKTILFVTHSIREAILLSDRVFVMSHRPALIVREVAIPFRRPRGMEEILSQEFGEIETMIRISLESGIAARAGGAR